MFAAEGDCLVQRGADLHEIWLHLLDTHTNPIIALKQIQPIESTVAITESMRNIFI